MNDNDEENLLAGRITLEQLLLAANVLSAQNPQGQDFDRRRLLEEAHELAEQAREVAFMTAFNRNYRRSERMRYFVKLGYDRLGELEFVPFEQAAVEITGLASRKQAIKRFEKFMKEFPGLRELYAEVHRLGIWRDLIEDLKIDEGKHFEFRNRQTKRLNPSGKKKRRTTSSAPRP